MLEIIEDHVKLNDTERLESLFQSQRIKVHVLL